VPQVRARFLDANLGIRASLLVNLWRAPRLAVP